MGFSRFSRTVVMAKDAKQDEKRFREGVPLFINSFDTDLLSSQV